MKITVDTNILVSATFWSGDSFKIIERVENKEIELILSKEIIKEYSEVLQYKEIQDKIKNKNLEMKYPLEKIQSMAKMIEKTRSIDIIKEDSTDNKFLECAVAGQAAYIISKDKHLLKLKEFENIKIILPEEFLRIIKNEKK